MDISRISIYLILPATHIHGNTEDMVRGGGTTLVETLKIEWGEGRGAQPHLDVSYRTKQGNLAGTKGIKCILPQPTLS